jgi:hypothetical protein
MIIMVNNNRNSPKPIHNNFYPEISIIKEDGMGEIIPASVTHNPSSHP